MWAVVASLLAFSAAAMLFFESHAQNHQDFGPEYLHWTRRLGRGFYKCMVSYTMTGAFEPMTPAGRFYAVVFSFVVLLVQSAYTANLAGAPRRTGDGPSVFRRPLLPLRPPAPDAAARRPPAAAFFTHINQTVQLIQSIDTFAVGTPHPPPPLASKTSRVGSARLAPCCNIALTRERFPAPPRRRRTTSRRACRPAPTTSTGSCPAIRR